MDINKLRRCANLITPNDFAYVAATYLSSNMTRFNKNLEGFSVTPWLYIQAIFELAEYLDEPEYDRAATELNTEYFRTGAIGLDEVENYFRKYGCKFENGDINSFLFEQWIKYADWAPGIMNVLYQYGLY